MAREYKQFPLPRLRELRLERKLSTRKLAEIAHISRATVVEIEAGRRSNPRTRDALAEALDIHPWRLIFPDEHVNAALEDDAQENRLIEEWLATKSAEEIRQLMDSPAGEKIRTAIEHDARERERLEEERVKEAG
jgi:transcriptional regulator with XRE-family HTH domain